jgi:hypothetical protein
MMRLVYELSELLEEMYKLLLNSSLVEHDINPYVNIHTMYSYNINKTDFIKLYNLFIVITQLLVYNHNDFYHSCFN